MQAKIPLDQVMDMIHGYALYLQVRPNEGNIYPCMQAIAYQLKRTNTQFHYIEYVGNSG